MHTISLKNQYFVCENVAFSKQEQKEILKYLKAVLQKLDWVETDPLKLDFLLDPFFKSCFVYPQNKMIVSKKVIVLFYVLRKRLNVSDTEIIDSIYFCFERNNGLFIEHLEESVFSYWGIIE